MFDRKNIKHYLFALTLIIIASYVGNSFKDNYYENNNQEYDMIKEYLLNESPLYGANKPKLWIHSKYEINSRKWLDFQSRNTNNLNQPYLDLTIQSIIDHCSNDFHICLIDDETFSKLIPDWDVVITNVAEPMKSDLREVAFLKLLYLYGGIIVPDSFVCTNNLIDLYLNCIQNDKPFIAESINKHNNMQDIKRTNFVPNTYFMGSEKKHPVIEFILNVLINKAKNGQFTSEFYFSGEEKKVFVDIINKNKMTLLNGKFIGIKDNNNKPILLEDLIEEKYLEIPKNIYGIYIPKDEILKRTKYNWFSVLSKKEFLDSNMAIVKYIKASMVDTDEAYKKSFESKMSI
tara:strand:- start:86 stop:1123 length:1038 start_codon:yes stop_codon:yes gene_type:complete